MVILITGTGCAGKSTLAMALAERLNITSVLQTDMVYYTMMSMERHLNKFRC
jgi:2-phosphoglycerate kinase